MVDESWSTQVRKGVLELCILNLLREEPLYGYEIVKRLETVPGLVISEGTIYPILNRLRKEKLVTSSLQESDRGPVRKYYALTAEGRRRMEQMNEHWDELTRSLGKIVR